MRKNTIPKNLILKLNREMPESTLIITDCEDDPVAGWSKTIDLLAERSKKSSAVLGQLMIIRAEFIPNGDLNISELDAYIKHLDWIVRQATFQIKFKKLERQIIRMMLAETFDPVKAAFLERYDEMAREVCELFEEGVSINEMTENDYRSMVDNIMKFRNDIQTYPD